MQEVVRSLSEHPLVAIAVGFAVLLILYVLFKSIIKLALIMIIIAVAIGGYYYFSRPGGKPADFKDAVERARSDAGRAVETGKEALEKSREIVGKGKEVIEKGREMVDKGKAVLDAEIEKGRETVDRGKGAAGEIGKIVGGERDSDKK